MAMIPERRFLVTAGSTRERIDAVRVWGNVFTGNTGLAIAMELARLEGAQVELLTSNPDHVRRFPEEAGPGCSAGTFQTHAELRAALNERLARQSYDGIFMTAAVADYRPVRVFEVVSREPASGGEERWKVRDVQAGKVRSSYAHIAVLGERTEKLVDLFRREWGHRGLLVKFKLEVGVDEAKLLAIGRASRRASDADYLVANTLEMVEGERAGAFLIDSNDGARFIPRPELAARLAAIAGAWRARDATGDPPSESVV